MFRVFSGESRPEVPFAPPVRLNALPLTVTDGGGPVDVELIQPAELLSDAWRNAPLGGPITALVSRLLGIDGINRLYASVAMHEPGLAFYEAILREMQVTVQVTEGDLQRIPVSSTIVAVANHPFGAIEGIVLAWVLLRVRPDVRVMANFLLQRLPQMRETLIPVDPFGGSQAKAQNLRGLRHAVAWLRQSGALGIFPAGEVSHWNAEQRRVTDPPWNANVARLIRQARATTVPVYFEGANGLPFQVAGMVHPRLRTAQLGNELLNKRNCKIEVRIGNALPAESLREAVDDLGAIELLRKRVYLLSNRGDGARPHAVLGLPVRFPHSRRRMVAEASSREAIAAAVARLPRKRELAGHGEFAVYVTSWQESPEVVREIGRLREITFREVGEGTGKPLDLDAFDRTYQHLFVYNREQSEVVGAYRIARVHETIGKFGFPGLYLSTLFQFEPAFFRHLGKALELGRSFVRKEYQRTYAPLMLLWKGIGKLVLEDSSCTRLLGPVSISNSYSRSSRQIVVDTLQGQNVERRSPLCDLSQFVRPRRPFQPRRVPGWDQQWMRALLRDVDGLSSLVEDLESDGKGIPVLLRQYLKLGGHVLAFNVDPSFADALDGLIVVDLREADRRVLAKYLGKEGAQAIPDGVPGSGATGARSPGEQLRPAG